MSTNATYPEAPLPAYEAYLCRAGDRWDTLAYELLGDAARAPVLLSENPHLPTTPQLPAGARIYVPLSVPEDPVDTEQNVPL